MIRTPHAGSWRWPAAVAGLIIVAGMAIGFFGHLEPTGQPVSFAPNHVDLSTEFRISGEAIDVEVQLRNESNAPIRITEIPRACACMAVDTGGRDLEFPILLAPGENVPLRTRILTDGRLGVQTFSLTARSVDGAGAALPDAPLSVTTKLYGGLIVVPPAFIETVSAGATVTRTVTLADDWPGSGIGVTKVSASTPGVFSLTLHPKVGPMRMAGRALKKRYDLEIAYTPPSQVSKFDEVVRIETGDLRVGTIEIPFQGNIRTPFSFAPESLAVYGEPGQTYRRVVFFEYAATEYAELRVLQAPADCAVEIERGVPKGKKRVTISGTLPNTARVVMTELHLRVGESGAAAIIPITLISAVEATKR